MLEIPPEWKDKPIPVELLITLQKAEIDRAFHARMKAMGWYNDSQHHLPVVGSASKQFSRDARWYHYEHVNIDTVITFTTDDNKIWQAAKWSRHENPLEARRFICENGCSYDDFIVETKKYLRERLQTMLAQLDNI